MEFDKIQTPQTNAKSKTKGTQMARKCFFTGKGPMVGNNVSHANNKTKKRSLPNLRTIRIKLDDGTSLKVRVAASTLRTMRKHNS